VAYRLYPDGNVTTGWTSGTYTTIDETPYSDSDFAYAGVNATQTFEVSLNNPPGTPASGTCTVNYRYAQVNSSGVVTSGGTAATITVHVYQGASLVASGTTRTGTGAWQADSFTFNTSSVSNWNDVRLRFVSVGSGGSPASNRRGGAVSFGEIQTPDLTISGTLSKTLAAFTTTTTGKVSIKGTASNALAAFTTTTAGKLSIKGTASKTLAAFTVSGTGSSATPITGTLSKTLAAFTTTTAGKLSLKGGASVTLAAFTTTTAGKLSIKASASKVLAAFTTTTSGRLSVKGAASPVLATFTTTTTGKLSIKGSTSKTLAAFTVSASGTGGVPAITGALSITLGALTASGVARSTVKGSLDKLLSSFTVTSTGKLSVKGSTSAALVPLSLTASGAFSGGLECARVSQAYFELPTTGERARVSQAYFELPTTGERVRVSQAYFELPEMAAQLGGSPIRHRKRRRIRREELEDLTGQEKKAFLKRVQRAIDALHDSGDRGLMSRAKDAKEGLLRADSPRRKSIAKLDFDVILSHLELVSLVLNAYEDLVERRRKDDEAVLALILSSL
jgi:hypothetical protein